MWLFFKFDQPYQSQAAINSIEMISITALGLYRIPCEMQIQCSDINLPTISSINESIFMRPTNEKIYKQISNVRFALHNFSNRLLTTYTKYAIQTLRSPEQ